jgi:hypothetical protein
MPLSKYDPLFGGDARKALAEMTKKYGDKKGRQVFYAMVNKRKKSKRGAA